MVYEDTIKFEPDNTEVIEKISLDEKTGSIVINEIRYRACDSSYEIVEDEKKKNVLFLIGFALRDENNPLNISGQAKYYFKDVCSFFTGYKGCGKILSEFKNKYPALVEKSQDILNHEVLYKALNNGELPSIAAPDGLLLKNGEHAIWVDNDTEFCQEKTKTKIYGGGPSIRIAKGVNLRLSAATPIKTEYIAVLDTGRLVLTNKQIVFKGERKSVTIPLSKVVDLTMYSDSVSIAKEGAQKMYIFKKIDGALWYRMIQEATQLLS